MTQSREVRLKDRPVGLPSAKNFELATVTLGAPGPGEVQVKNTWMTVDPYMRGRMYAGPSYSAPFNVGEAMTGGAIGEVIASNAPSLKPGDIVRSFMGWREAFNAPADQLEKLDTMGLAPQLFLGAAGMPGLTAWAGLMRVAAFKPGDTVFVSGAAGAVGSMVAQIARLKGGKVIGSAGGAEKIAYLNAIGVHGAIDYKAVPDLTKALLAAAPDGIDVYFDNVGGGHLEAALNAAKLHARFAICGGISAYNNIGATPGPSNFLLIVGKRIRMEGFIVSDHADMAKDYVPQLAAWVKDGKVDVRETVAHGIENAVDAFLQLFSGGNLGKMLVRL